MRRARIQMKPNLAKSAKTTTPAAPVATTMVERDTVLEGEPNVSNVEATIQRETTDSSASNMVDNVQVAPAPPATDLQQNVSPVDNLNMLEEGNRVENRERITPPCVLHVHFDAQMEREHISMDRQSSYSQNSPQKTMMMSPQGPGLLRSPRSRNISLCLDEESAAAYLKKERKKFSGEEELDTKKMKMMDLVWWNPKKEKGMNKRERRSSTSSTIVSKNNMNMDSPAKAPAAPQVKIGADGKLVIDETSLLVSTLNSDSIWETVEEGKNSSRTTSLSFRTRLWRKGTTWTDRETDLFYEVLRCTGPDFGLMHHYLPSRARNELKAKYNREEKVNWARMNSVMSQPACLDYSLHDRVERILRTIEEEQQEKKELSEMKKMEDKRVREEAREMREEETRLRKLEKRNMKADKIAEKTMLKEERMAQRVYLLEERKSTKERLKMQHLQRKLESGKPKKEKKIRLLGTKKSYNPFNEFGEWDESKADLLLEAVAVVGELQKIDNRNRRKEEKAKKHAEMRLLIEMGKQGDGEADANDTLESGGELGDTTSESSSSEESDSDYEAKRIIAREDKRHKKLLEQEEVERAEAGEMSASGGSKKRHAPRTSNDGKKPCYNLNGEVPKFSASAFSKAIAVVRQDGGGMFDSAEESDGMEGTKMTKRKKETTPAENMEIDVTTVCQKNDGDAGQIPTSSEAILNTLEVAAQNGEAVGNGGNVEAVPKTEASVKPTAGRRMVRRPIVRQSKPNINK